MEAFRADGDAEGRQLIAAAERGRTDAVARRIVAMTPFFLAAILASGALQSHLQAEGRVVIAVVFGVQFLVCTSVYVVARIDACRRHLSGVAAAGVILYVASIDWYLLRVGASLEEVAFTGVGTLAALSVALPWTWRHQLVVAAGVVTAFAGVAPLLRSAMDPVTLFLSVLTLATLTVVATVHIDRFRMDALRQAATQRDEAEIAAALARVGEILHTHLRDPDMLEQVNRLALDVLSCDWSGTYLWDVERSAYVLQALVGTGDRERRDALAAVTFRADDQPLFRRFETERIIEIADGEHQDLVDPALLRAFGITSAICTPIVRQAHVSGVLVHGHRTQRGPFGVRARRIALGIAHVVAVAVENARLLRAAEAASALKSEFVATMSHELRTPLNIIVGYADLLHEGTFGALNDPQQEHLGRVARNARVLLDLVNTMLDLGRLEGGHVPIDREPVVIDELLGTIVAEAHGLGSNSLVVTRTDRPELVVLTDRDKLKTILKNLVVNAIKFTPTGHVRVDADWDDGTLVMKVEDTGIGIAAEHHATIFEMFRQLDGSATRRFEGIGLGLHIVRRLVDVLKGEILVTSTVGVGSTFVVSIPCARVSSEERRIA